MKKTLVISAITLALLIIVSACGAKATPVESIARPSNPGGPGKAVDLKGDAVSGEKIFVANCVLCHGDQGTGGVANLHTADGTVPPLNPIDETLKSSDYKTFATNIDLFIEHGSTPELANGASDPPEKVMFGWGDTATLKPQQIADVIAYIISLNK